jgi:hypothetical protein
MLLFAWVILYMLINFDTKSIGFGSSLGLKLKLKNINKNDHFTRGSLYLC